MWRHIPQTFKTSSTERGIIWYVNLLPLLLLHTSIPWLPNNRQLADRQNGNIMTRRRRNFEFIDSIRDSLHRIDWICLFCLQEMSRRWWEEEEECLLWMTLCLEKRSQTTPKLWNYGSKISIQCDNSFVSFIYLHSRGISSQEVLHKMSFHLTTIKYHSLVLIYGKLCVI